jgi:hypothetical protein
MGFVYRWHDSSNGKYYVGSHKGSTDSKYIGSGILFRRAYDKRPNDFEREILYVGEDYRELEELVLLTLDAAADPKSYNMKNAAMGGNMGPEAIKKMIAKVTGRKASEATREKLRNRVFSPETREKMSQAFVEYSVYCGVNGKTYSSSKDAALDLGYSPIYIRQMANNTKKNRLQLQRINKNEQ